jgi:hypothetical protein
MTLVPNHLEQLNGNKKSHLKKIKLYKSKFKLYAKSLLEFRESNNGKFQPKSNKVDRLYKRKLY